MEPMESQTTDEKAPLNDNGGRNNQYCTKSKKLIFGLVAVVSCLLIASGVKHLHKSSFKCELPVYDEYGILLDASAPCSEAMKTVLAS